MKRSRLYLVLVAAGVVSLSGCATLGAKPWQRGLLAREEMQIGGNRLDAAWDAHVYFSKEATSGGSSFGGGGCGCN